MKSVLWFLVLLVAWGGLAAMRLIPESRDLVRSRASKNIVGSRYDPRGFDNVDKLVKRRESEAFKDRLKRGIQTETPWPGLQSAQTSWTWLEVLNGLHHESSYEGDFSWMFSKLNTLIGLSDKREIRFLTGLAPFFLVIGKDHAGASLLVQSIITRGKDEYNPWFYAGFHALENLANRQLAADYYLRASRFPVAPFYLSALHLRLKYGYDAMSAREKGDLLKNEIKDEDLLEKIKKARPAWFD